MAYKLFLELWLCPGSGIAHDVIKSEYMLYTSIIETETHPVPGMRRNIYIYII